ncbi:MAG: lipid kinase [Rhodospirillales bacterium CG15_BIG_FIL_POST_REV_8_21_14_020_66_15]|nr:MAG: lipid kinase [Rhodospirillales bacterium CG15_BIG_FIL_POST_REV_8_21_14_020_66_15]
MPDSNALPGEPDTLPAAPRKVLVIFNPTAGMRRRARLDRVLARMRAFGADVTLYETAARGDAERAARETPAGPFDAIVAAGGDGTINEVINGLAGRQVPLGIIPLGTANVLAAELGLPGDDDGLARTIALGCTRPITLGEVNGRRFVQMAGVGFDAHVVASVDAGLKRLIGKLAYVWETLRGFFRFRFRPYRLTVDGKAYDVGSAVIANGHFYGGRFVCAKDARLGDPRLHVCLFKSVGPWSALRYAAWMVLGRLDRLPDYEVVPATSIVVEGMAGEPVQGDGDIVARLPLAARVSADRLDMLVPA